MPKSEAQKMKEKKLEGQARIQIKEGTSQSEVQSGILPDTPQIMETSSSASEPMRTQDQPDSNTVSVKSASIVIQNSNLQSQSNMLEFLKASAAGYNLLDRFMANIGAHMDKDFEAYLKQTSEHDKAQW